MRSVLIIVATVVVAEPFFSCFGKGCFGKGKKEDYCKDSAPDFCAKKVQKGFCTSQFHTKDEIKAKCMKSCHMCCGDRDEKMCKEKKDKIQNFCNSSFIEPTELKAMCGKTCNLCNDEPYSKYHEYSRPLDNNKLLGLS
ncbi:ShTK domain protein [Trichostrongylus colubriformis]|uniref:ShTK domain protein n=1 Tax=Trichostrongylus colubriformis TaxID=6319 RepID=A0AAN8FFM8_TRICO